MRFPAWRPEIGQQVRGPAGEVETVAAVWSQPSDNPTQPVGGVVFQGGMHRSAVEFIQHYQPEGASQ